MSLVTPNQGEVECLSRILNKVTPADVELRLFVNDIVPDEGTVVGDLIECSAAGYAAKTLPGANWTISTDANDVTTAEYPEQIFSLSEAATIYGYYVTSNGVLLWLERFPDAPWTFPDNGGDAKVTPRYTLD